MGARLHARMRRPRALSADADDVQIAGFVPRWLALPGGVIGVERTVRVTPDRINHIRQRRPAWLKFCLKHIPDALGDPDFVGDRKSTRLNSSHLVISYAVFCLKKKNTNIRVKLEAVNRISHTGEDVVYRVPDGVVSGQLRSLDLLLDTLLTPHGRAPLCGAAAP